MKYEDRLYEYEKEKRRLMNKGLTYEEYEKAIRELVKKWRI